MTIDAELLHSKNYILEMFLSHVKVLFKCEPQKLNFAMAKAISKNNILDCICKFGCIFRLS